MSAVKIKNVELEKERLSVALQELAPQVKEKEKAVAIIELDSSMSTINKYLRGDIGFVPVAKSIYDVLRREVLKRQNADVA